MTTPFSYLSPKTEVRAAPEKGGFAVFARQPLEKDELICVWTGRAITYAEMLTLSGADKSHTIQVDEGVYLAPLSPQVEPADCVNHSCAPNAGIRGQISLVAMRPIQANEEITFDYAMADSTPFDEFPCSCGAPTCRGRVTGKDWQNPELWARYRGYFSTYLQRRIRILKNHALPFLTGQAHKNRGLRKLHIKKLKVMRPVKKLKIVHITPVKRESRKK